MTWWHAGILASAAVVYEARETQDIDDRGRYVNWCTFNAHGAARDPGR
jgi:hypothetical protein